MRILLLLLLSGIAYVSVAQKQSMLEMKRAAETRWRFGQGISVGEPTGIQLSFYKARDICTFRKHLAIEVYASQEGLLLSSVLSKFDSTWTKGGIRVGIDYLWFFPVRLNKARPYFGLGIEGGIRNIKGESIFSYDAIAKVGNEWNFMTMRWSRKTSSMFSFFIEVKYNYCITSEFNYVLPSAGIKLHLL
jgi:hypothetical protein